MTFPASFRTIGLAGAIAAGVLGLSACTTTPSTSAATPTVPSNTRASVDAQVDAAHGRRVAFRTLDIGSDKVVPYMKPQDEPNPAMGWRAIRVGLDKPGVLRMQAQALIRAARGRPLAVMFPFKLMMAPTV